MKGISPLISTVLILLIATMAIGIALTIGTPVIDRATQSATINEGLQNMKILDNLIREVASEGKGSFRTIQLRVTDGEYKMNSKTNTMEFTYTIKSGIIESGTFFKDGNVFIAAGTNAKASKYDLDADGTADMVLENEIMRVALLNNDTNGNGINTSRIVRLFNLKENGRNITINDSRILIDNRTESSFGRGFTELVREGDNLAAAEAVVHINTSVPANLTYDIVYSLRSGADFLIVKIQNITDYINSSYVPTFARYQLEYKIGESKRDDVYDIGTINETLEARNLTHQFDTSHANLTQKYVCSYDDAQYSDGLLLSLIHSGKGDRLDYVNVSSLMDDSLIGFWQLNENSGTSTADSSGNGHTGTLTNATSATCFSNNACPDWTDGRYKRGLEFSGGGDLVNFTGITDYVYTISLWFRPNHTVTSSSDIQQLVRFNMSIELGAATGVCTDEVITLVGAPASGVTGRSCVTGITISSDWHHIAIVWNSDSSSYDIYLDGVAQAVTAGTGDGNVTLAYANSTSFTPPAEVAMTSIGGYRNDHAANWNFTIDDVRVYSRSLSAEEVSRLYNSSFAQYYSYSTSIRQKLTGSSLIIPFTKGTCQLISDNFYLVSGQDIPSKPFASYELGGEDIPVQIFTTYDRLQLNGTDRFSTGSNKLCVSNEGVHGGKPLIWARLC